MKEVGEGLGFEAGFTAEDAHAELGERLRFCGGHGQRRLRLDPKGDRVHELGAFLERVEASRAADGIDLVGVVGPVALVLGVIDIAIKFEGDAMVAQGLDVRDGLDRADMDGKVNDRLGAVGVAEAGGLAGKGSGDEDADAGSVRHGLMDGMAGAPVGDGSVGGPGGLAAPDDIHVVGDAMSFPDEMKMVFGDRFFDHLDLGHDGAPVLGADVEVHELEDFLAGDAEPAEVAARGLEDAGNGPGVKVKLFVERLVQAMKFEVGWVEWHRGSPILLGLSRRWVGSIG